MSLQGLREHDGDLTEMEDPGEEQRRMLRVWVLWETHGILGGHIYHHPSSAPFPEESNKGSFNGFSCCAKGSMSLTMDSKPIPPLSCRCPSLWHDHAARPNPGGGVNPVLGA